jgi:fucose 4-O-acetylase-like acetyltransferase
MKNAKGWISHAFNLTILEKNRYSWVDYLRGVIILLVVYHHAYLGIERSGIPMPETVGKANMIFYSFRMPLFFIISGVFTTISLSKQSVKDLVFVKYDKILYPYFIWAFIQVTLQIFMSHFTNSDRSIHDYLYILYQPKQLDQFWYLPALFNATMVFIFFKTKVKPNMWVHLIIGFVLFILAPFLNDISMMSNWMRFYLFFVIGDLISGILFTKTLQQQLKKPITLLIFLPVFIAAQVVYLHNNVGVKAMETTIETFHGDNTLYALNELNFLFTSLIGCITLIIMAFLLEKWNKLSFLRVIGFHSLYIYMIHVIVVGLVRSVLVHFLHFTNPIIILLCVIAFGVTIPIMFYNLLGRSYLWFLFSTRKKTKIELVPKQALPIQPLTHTHSQAKPDIRST